MVTLACVIVAVVGSAFIVDIDASLLVSHLKEAIKADMPNNLKDVGADKLQLCLARRVVGRSWSGRCDARRWTSARLRPDEVLAKTQERQVLWRAFRTDEGKVYVLVRVPESPASGATAATLPLTAEHFDMVMEKVLKKQNEKMAVFSTTMHARARKKRYS